MGKEYLEVEKPFLDLLEKIGWDTIHFTEEEVQQQIPNTFPAKTERKDFDEIIIEPRFKQSIKNLNKWLTDEQVEDALNEVKRIGLRKGLITANEDFWKLLIEPPTFRNTNNPAEKSRAIKLIDFENPENNNFLAINQFRVNTPGTLRNYILPDITLFINGIPVSVVECKYPEEIGVDPIEEAIRQLKRYSNSRESSEGAEEREGNERLFHYNQLMIVTSKDEARIGTITSEYEHFLEWKDTYPLELNKNWNPQEKLILGALTKKNLVDLIRNFVLFTDSSENRIKIVGRYHQYRAVNKVIDRLENSDSPEKRSGVVWHTQGSGKSMSMVFLIKKLRTNENLKSYKSVIVTDRTDLEEQLSGTAGLAETVYEIKNPKQLRDQLSSDSSNLVMVMAQKFLKRTSGRSSEDELPTYEEFPLLNNSEKILILVDEAHRTQSGVFGDNLANSLPKASRIAFTGTPLITNKVKKKTYERFGTYIDKYKMKEAKEDGAILGIKYEGKTFKGRVKNKTKMDEAFEDMFVGKTKEEIAEIQKKYGTKGKILEAKKRIEAISKNIVKHYFENIFDDGFKAQVVASSRIAAERYKDYIDKAIKEYIAEYSKSPNANKERIKKMKFISSACKITWKNNDLPKLIRYSKEANSKLGKDNINFKSKINFNKPNTGISFLIVKDMLLTGFDAPIEQVMYVDKRMTDHTLLQAIARVNRVAKGKECGLIVDYYGITNHLKEALDAYSSEDLDLEDTFSNLTTEIPILKYRYEQLIKFFKENKIKEIEEYVNYKMPVGKQLDFLDNCIILLGDVKLRADFNVKFKLFLKSMDILMSKPVGKEYIKPLKAFGHIHERVRRHYRDDSINILGAGNKIRKLIDEYLVSVGINTKIKPVDIISDSFDDAVNKNRSPQTQASEMEHAIRKHCKVMLNSDPVYYKKISEKLEEILKKFKENWEEQVKLLKNLKEQVKKGRESEENGMDAKKHAPFYDLIKDTLYKNKDISKQESEELKKLIYVLVEVMILKMGKVSFKNNPHNEKIVRAELDELLLYSGNNEIIDKKEKIVSDFIKLAKNRSGELLK